MNELGKEYNSLGETPTREQIVDLVHNAIEKEGFYSFGSLHELLSANKSVIEHSADMVALLEILANGNWQAYKVSGMANLSTHGEIKLKELTLMNMCVGRNELELSEVQSQLDLKDEELAKFLITSMYHEIITGKVNSEKKLLMVYGVQSGEVSNQELDKMEHTLSNWIERLDTMISSIDKKITHAS